MEKESRAVEFPPTHMNGFCHFCVVVVVLLCLIGFFIQLETKSSTKERIIALVRRHMRKMANRLVSIFCFIYKIKVTRLLIFCQFFLFKGILDEIKLSRIVLLLNLFITNPVNKMILPNALRSENILHIPKMRTNIYENEFLLGGWALDKH